jgi:hypothetical protein
MRRTASHLFRFVALGIAIVGVSACDVVVTSLESKGKAEDQWTKTYSLASGDLEIVNVNGSIEVVGAEGGDVQVVAERTAQGATDDDAKKILAEVQTVEEVGPTRIRLEIKAPAGGGRRLTVKYHVKVPAAVNVRLVNQNGSLDASAIKGTLKAETGNGSVKGRDLGGTVEVSTTNGSVRLDVTGVASGGIRAGTVNGSVEVSIPSAARADVQASCINGRISLDGLKLDGPESTRRRVEGRLNGGGPKVVLETTNGAIRLTGK